MSNFTDEIAELDGELANWYGATEASALKTIVIQTPTVTTDSNGESSATSWATFATVTNTMVTENQMSETENDSDQVESKIEVEFEFDYTAGVTSDMRISYNSQLYNITGVISDETAAYRMYVDTELITLPEAEDA